MASVIATKRDIHESELDALGLRRASNDVHASAIEDAVARDAIVRTVDGGDDAFRHRRLEYGF